ncbi:MAG: N-acetylmuramoyl-L-alanine amidase, partial [Lachnospiraceae bacterium]|nr:N-acetylmuramoyl-L-alanine amidase [Lachnospiraceae bacterium]
MILLFVVGMGFGIYEVYRLAKREPVEQPELTVDYLTENPYSRPGDELKKVKNIFVHYTANPG